MNTNSIWDITTLNVVWEYYYTERVLPSLTASGRTKVCTCCLTLQPLGKFGTLSPNLPNSPENFKDICKSCYSPRGEFQQ